MTHDHRKLGVEFNNRTWDLLEKRPRTHEEDQELIHAAHASLAHWLKAGTAVHQQRGEWLISRVYVELGRLEPATHHLRETERVFDTCKGELRDFEFAFLEALRARVAALANDRATALVHYTKAQSLGEKLGTDEDRRIFFAQLHEGEWFGFAP